MNGIWENVDLNNKFDEAFGELEDALYDTVEKMPTNKVLPIEAELIRNSELIEGALDGVLPQGDAPHGVIYEAMRYSARGGGKHIRPYLTLEFCRALGGDTSVALPYACAVECVHTYSLIHDDLPSMDNDDVRRGKPSLHRAYGEANALLAGDALLTYAFALIAENPFADAEQNVRAVSALASSAGYDGMIGGQVCDLLYVGKKITPEELFETERKKTGELIAASAALGLIAADAGGRIPAEIYAAARRYAYSIGLSFQIVDDILDADKGRTDETSVIALMGVEDAKKLASELTDEAIEAANHIPNPENLKALAVYLRDRTM